MNAVEWRCKCGVLLGFKRGTVVEMTFKGTVYTVTAGTVVAECRRCKQKNEIK